jgi:hypothetical protein
MTIARKSRKLLFIATAATIISLVLVLGVYAAVFLGTINGGTVTVGGVTTGTIYYNINADGTGTWATTLSPAGAWYTQLSLPGTYSGPVAITWQLQSYATGSWVDVSGASVTTTITLTGAAQLIYATPTGVITANHDWSGQASGGGQYRVFATVNSAP